MPERWVVHADRVWKRYCRTLRRSVRYALADGARSFAGLRPGNTALREDEFWSLRDVSFRLAPGEGLALVGTNGAGKSTLLRILSGVIAPDRGELRVRGRIVSLMMAGAGFHPVLTGRENILVYGSILGMRRREIERRIPAILEFADLAEFVDTPVKYYSTGMYMRLAFSVAAQSTPDVFVIDEVLAVGDVAFREKCVDHLQGMKERGAALLLVSHSSGHLRRLADHGLWLRRGECLAQGPIEGVLDLYLDELQARAEAPAGAAPAAAGLPAAAATETVGAPAAAVAERDGSARDPSAGGPAAGRDPHGSEAAPAEIELLQPAPGATIELTAHRETRLVFRVRSPAPCLEPEVQLSVATAGGMLAGAALVLSAATFPQLQAGRALILTFAVRPHLAEVRGELVLQLSRPDAAGGRLLGARRWPCHVRGRTATGRGPDLEPEFLWRPFDRPGPSAPQRHTTSADDPADGPRRTAATSLTVPCERATTAAPAATAPAVDHVVHAGDPVPLAVGHDRQEPPVAWLLHGAAGEPVARVPLPQAPAGAEAVLQGRFRAHLAPGSYRQALEIGGEQVPGGSFQVAEPAEPVGHVDLDATCHVVAGDAATAATGAQTAGAALQLGEFVLAGSTPALDQLLGSPTRLPAAAVAGPPLTALATGERCRARLRVHAHAPLRGFDVTVGFGHPERGRCAGMRLRRDAVLDGAGAFDVCFDFAAHLARGEYRIGCSVTALDAQGRPVEAHRPDLARCFVLGPTDTGSDGSLEVTGLEAADRGALAAPEPAAEARDLDGSGLRLLGFSLNGRSGEDRAAMPSGTPATAAVDVLAASEVTGPSFKFAFVNDARRCVARMTGFEQQHPLEPLPAGAARTYRMHFTPHLVGGCYEVQVALLRRTGTTAAVTDRRHRAACCVVPARTKPLGPGWLEARVLVEVERT